MDKKGEAVFRIPNPQLHADPDRIKFSELYKYRGIDDARRAVTIRNFRAALGYVGITAFVGLIGVMVGKAAGKNQVHGHGGNGGDFLDLTTKFSDADYNYNREFQRMRYLSEIKSSGQKVDTTGYQLAELGLRETNLPAGNFKKRAPHYKYY